MRAKGILLAGLTVIAVGHAAFADTHSDFNKGYNLAALKTFDFKQQSRISRDPIADNQVWGDEIRKAIGANLVAHGMVEDGVKEPDFMVAFYVGLRDRYDVRSLGYGVPFYGRGFRRWGRWPLDYDAWALPYDHRRHRRADQPARLAGIQPGSDQPWQGGEGLRRGGQRRPQEVLQRCQEIHREQALSDPSTLWVGRKAVNKVRLKPDTTETGGTWRLCPALAGPMTRLTRNPRPA